MVIQQKPPKIIGVIPARYGSTRFPGKPLVAINDKSLIQRTYENARLCPLLDDLVVATDNQQIYDHVMTFGKAIMTSPECATGTDRIAEAIKKTIEYNEVEIVVNIQGDEPCINPDTISRTIEVLDQNPLAEMSTAITRVTDAEEALSSSVVKCVRDNKGRALYFSRALIPSNKQQVFLDSVVYYRHIGLYAYRKDFLFEYSSLEATKLQLAEDLEQLKVIELGYTIMTAVVNDVSVGVDVPGDVQKVVQLLEKISVTK